MMKGIVFQFSIITSYTKIYIIPNRHDSQIIKQCADVNCQIKKKEEFNLSDSECNIYQLFEKEHDNLSPVPQRQEVEGRT